MPVVGCPTPTPPVHGVVQFSLSEWTTQCPEFAGMTQAQGQASFNDATLHLANSCRSLIKDANKRLYLLYLLTCHVCFLRFGSNDGNGKVVQAPGIVGRVSNASEGTVSVASQIDATVKPQGMAWYVQTPWGFNYWQATAKYRTFRYVPPPPPGLRNEENLPGLGIGPVGTGFPGFNGGSS